MAQKPSFLSPETNTIKTPTLTIRKNLMIWHGTMIQLSNISYISAVAPDQLPFPDAVMGAFVAGILCTIMDNSMLTLLGGILICCGAAGVFRWYSANTIRRLMTNLIIHMNSGQTLQFKFDNKEFLAEVITVLEQIMLNGGATKQNIEINIKDSVISKSNVLNDLTAQV